MSAEANKAIKDMTHEEALAALPRLREEATRANARVHEAMERVTQTDEVPTHVDVHGDHLVISVRGRELAMTFFSDLRIPLEHVQGVKQTRRSSNAVEGMASTRRPPAGVGSTTCMVIETRLS